MNQSEASAPGRDHEAQYVQDSVSETTLRV